MTMGSLRRQLISDAEICRRYRDNEALSTIGKRAGLWTSDLLAVLTRNGMPIRSPGEINRSKGRRPNVGTLTLKTPC
jgi:hypothetical protein